MSWIHFDGGTEDRGGSAGGGGSTSGGGGWSRRPVLNEIRYAHLKEKVNQLIIWHNSPMRRLSLLVIL